MTDKLPLLAGYLLLLISISMAPWSSAVDRLRAEHQFSLPTAWGLGLLTLAATSLAIVPRARPGLWIELAAGFGLLSTLFIVPKRSLDMVAVSISACALCSLLLWWVEPTAVGKFPIFLALGIWCALAAALSLRWSRSLHFGTHLLWVMLLTLGSWVVMHVGSFESRTHWGMAWHHWGAYWGPIEAAKAGLIPFSDIPLQYGTGPTALLSLLPVEQGFDGMRHAVTVLSVVGIAVVVDICVLLVKPLQHPLVSVIAGVAGAVACLLWTASPPIVATPMVTPSTFSLRFVPAFILLWTLIRFPNRYRLNYLLWVVCTLWSIESAFYACVIFWPSRLQLGKHGSLSALFSRIARVALEALVSIAALVCLWWLVYRLCFGIHPSLRLYILYALFPPGEMPVNWTGPVWWLLFVLSLAIGALHSRSIADSDKRTLHLCALCLIACSSYYLGRSHDNNIINLMPPAVMLLCALIGSGREAPLLSSTARSLLVATLALLPFFGFDYWRGMLPAKPQAWSESMSFYHASPPDLLNAINYVRKERNEFFEVIDQGPLDFEAYGPQGVWNSLHPLSNFPFVPSADRVRLLKVGAKKLNKPGWLIVQKSRISDPLVSDFSQVYQLSEQKVFGNFVAMRFAPPT